MYYWRSSCVVSRLRNKIKEIFKVRSFLWVVVCFQRNRSIVLTKIKEVNGWEPSSIIIKIIFGLHVLQSLLYTKSDWRSIKVVDVCCQVYENLMTRETIEWMSTVNYLAPCGNEGMPPSLNDYALSLNSKLNNHFVGHPCTSDVWKYPSRWNKKNARYVVLVPHVL